METRNKLNCCNCKAACCSNMIFPGITEAEISVLGEVTAYYTNTLAFRAEERKGLYVVTDLLTGKLAAKLVGQCQNLQDNKCTVYENRPRHCRDFQEGGEKCINIFLNIL